jgi:hypothetical protein
LVPDPEEAKRFEDAYLLRNRRIAIKLAAKGFNKFSINMLLHAGLGGNTTNPEADEI